MPEVSRFHWISHMAIDRCTLESSYLIDNEGTLTDKESFLHRKGIKETIIVNIHVNAKQDTKVKNDSPCTGWKRLNRKDAVILEIGSGSCGNIGEGHKCHFLCKWMEKRIIIFLKN